MNKNKSIKKEKIFIKWWWCTLDTKSRWFPIL